MTKITKEIEAELSELSQTDLKEREGELWDDWKNLKTDPSKSKEENLKIIEDKELVLDKINFCRTSTGKEIWNKWTKDEAIKKLDTPQNQGGKKFFSPARTTEQKLADVTAFLSVITSQKIKPEYGNDKESTLINSLDPNTLVMALANVFNGK